MRFVVLLLAAVLAFGAVAAFFSVVVRADRYRLSRRRRSARWRVTHHNVGGATVVGCELSLPDGSVLEESIVDRIPDGAPDWADRFLDARQTAEERAFHLNAGGSDD